MKLFRLFLLIFICNHFAFSQSLPKNVIDSINNIFTVSEKEGKEILMHYIKQYDAKKNIASVIELDKQFKNKLKDTTSIIDVNRLIREAYFKNNLSILENQINIEILELGKSVNDSFAITDAYHFLSISSIANDTNSLRKSIEYTNKSLDFLPKELGNRTKTHKHLNLGYRYLNLNNPDSCLFHHQLSLNYSDNKFDTIVALSNIARALSLFEENLDSSLTLYREVIRLHQENGSDTTWIKACGRFEIADIFLKLNQVDSAFYYAKIAQHILDNTLYFSFEINHGCSKLLADLYYKKNDLTNYKKYNDIAISVEKDRTESILKTNEFYNIYFLEREKEALATKEKLNQLEISKQKTEQYILWGIIGVIILTLLGVYRAFKLKSKANKYISQQKEKIEIAHTEIKDSIAYAKRIQKAILPSDKTVKENLINSFILYKPKDIVAGDFYWIEQNKDKILFAAADCTGHGVPGAMVSVICNNALNRSVREFDLDDPGQILDKTRELVIQEFEKSDEDVKDGMDIALCSLSEKKLKYSGANNPLWLIRKGSNQIEEIKGSKQPVGKHENSTAFTTQEINLNSGDIIYIFSDGYVDQFGGEKGKKFKAKALRELLLSIQNKSMSEQKELINSAFENWKGNLEQVDDVCFIGVKITD